MDQPNNDIEDVLQKVLLRCGLDCYTSIQTYIDGLKHEVAEISVCWAKAEDSAVVAIHEREALAAEAGHLRRLLRGVYDAAPGGMQCICTVCTIIRNTRPPDATTDNEECGS